MESEIKRLLGKVDILVQTMFFIKSQQANKEITKTFLLDLKALALTLKEKYEKIVEILQAQKDTNSQIEKLCRKIPTILDDMDTLEGVLDAAPPPPPPKQENSQSSICYDLTPHVEISTKVPVSLRKLPTKRLLMEMELVTDEEFKKLPKYIARSASLDVINKFVEVFNATLSKKYNIMGKKKSSLKTSEKKEYIAYKEKEIAELKGSTYISNLDLANELGQNVLDKKSLNLLIILRHLSRVREFRKGQTVAYIA